MILICVIERCTCNTRIMSLNPGRHYDMLYYNIWMYTMNALLVAFVKKKCILEVLKLIYLDHMDWITEGFIKWLLIVVSFELFTDYMLTLQCNYHFNELQIHYNFIFCDISNRKHCNLNLMWQCFILENIFLIKKEWYLCDVCVFTFKVQKKI